MIQIVTREGVVGFAIHPSLDNSERLSIVASLPVRPKAAFLGLAPTRKMLGFIDQLEGGAAKVKVVAFYDYHLNLCPEPEEVANARELEQKLLERAKIVETSSCQRLVAVNEWKEIGVNVVFFRADSSGFLGFLKGVGIVYPELDSDSDFLDGAGNDAGLSEIGRLLVDAHEYLVPVFSQNPLGYLREKTQIYQVLADWITEGCQSRTIAAFAGETRRASEESGLVCFQLLLRQIAFQRGLLEA